MTPLLWTLAVLAGWTALATAVAWFTARTIVLADEQSEAEGEAAKRRHPSWRGAA